MSSEKQIKLSIGARLLEERKRIDASQALLATHGEVSKVTQMKYEKDETSPNADYLAKVARFGVDVLYVVTGERTPIRQDVITWVEADDDIVDGRKVVHLDVRLQKLIDNFDAANTVGKRYIEAVAEFAARGPVTSVPDDDGPEAAHAA